MRKLLFFLVITALLSANCNTLSAEDDIGKDLNTVELEMQSSLEDCSNDWFEDDLKYLINEGNKIIDNLSYETFKPNENVTYGEFISYVMRILGHDFKKDNENWTEPYIKKAKIYNFIRPGEIEDYDKPITRGDTARIVSRTAKRSAGRMIYRPSEKLEKMICNYDTIDDKYKIYVMKVFDLGIMEGYKGKFQSDNLLTNAECVAILRRMLDTTARKVPQLEKDESREITDEEIAEQLKYIEDNICIGMSIDDIEKMFISKYRNFSLEDDMLDNSHSLIRKSSYFIFDGNNNYSNIEEDCTFLSDEKNEVGTITSIEDRYILIDNEIEITYYNIYTDLRVFVYNMLMTRKAGIMINVYSDDMYKVLGINVFYVTGEDNKINLIKYYENGSKELIENIEDDIIEYIY